MSTINEMIDLEYNNSINTQQSDHWLKSHYMSIYIDWVPDQLNQQNANEFFSKYGEVENIRFLNKVTDKGKKCSAFINFIDWVWSRPKVGGAEENVVHPDIESIARASPGYFAIPIELYIDKYGKVLRTFQLKCRLSRTSPKDTRNPKDTSNPKDRITKDRITKDRITKDRITKDRITKDRITKDRITKDRITKDRLPIAPCLPSNEERIFHLEQQVSILWREIHMLKSSFMPCPRF